MPGKRVHLNPVVLEAMALLGADEGKSFQELAEEAFSDLLQRYRPTLSACATPCAKACSACRPTPMRASDTDPEGFSP